ncbi:CD9 molecule b isoform X3 [Trichomycterus rosablanca]|uniref:CD9 molecule b isoform X3 n=1 Tax=Trichomycterus rosablanca TaxID=2290929 RepID=UPI002F359432
MAMLSSGEQVIKYLLFSFNFVIWLAGTGVLAVALWLRFDKRTEGLFQASDAPSTFLTGVYILIVAGALMMVVGFLGCCGAIKESPCLLGLFFIFLLIIFAAEVAAGIWGLSNKDKIVQDVKQFYTQTYNNYLQTKQPALKETLRLIQFGLQCCGTTGTIFDGAADTCPKKEGLDAFITTSCPAAIDEMFDSKMHIIGGVGIGIGVIMSTGGTVAKWVALSPHSKKVRVLSVWSLHVLRVCEGFLPQSMQDMQVSPFYIYRVDGVSDLPHNKHDLLHSEGCFCDASFKIQQKVT